MYMKSELQPDCLLAALLYVEHISKLLSSHGVYSPFDCRFQ